MNYVCRSDAPRSHALCRVSFGLLWGACCIFIASPSWAQTTLIARGAAWKYLDDGSDQGTAWRDPGFDDATWAAGPAQLGYGDGDEATVVSFGPNPNDRFITTYFRHSFQVQNPAQFVTLPLAIQRDDGAVVYLNGTEVFRTNMPAGAVTSSTRALSTISGRGEAAFLRDAVDAGLLGVGQNVLAVEIHQVSPTSSDISFDLRLWGSGGGPVVVRGPYLQTATPSSAIICWRTDLAADGRAWYGRDPQNLTQFVEDTRVIKRHCIEVSGLSSDTTYFYAVGSSAGPLRGGDADHFFRTSPQIGSVRPTRIWVIGDSGSANADAAAVRNAYQAFTGSRATDVWLMLGDNAYNAGTNDEYQAAVFEMYPMLLRNTFVWPTLGNHDAVSSDSPTQSGPYYNIFVLPRQGEAGGVASGTEAYYSFDHGNIHFICLDSHDTDRSPDGAMMTWLRADLSDTLAEWIIAFWHHPPYTHGSHNSDNPSDSGGRMRDMRQIALPILEAGGVDLVLSGHSHSYERSVLLNGHYDVSSTLDPSMILDDGDGRADGDGAYRKTRAAAHDGAVYLVAGSSGKIGGGNLNHPAMYISLRRLGSLVLDVDGSRLDASFVDHTGGVPDHFTIIKQRAGDLNCDGAINAFDIEPFILALFDPPAYRTNHPDCDLGLADINADGRVDAFDIEPFLAVLFP